MELHSSPVDLLNSFFHILGELFQEPRLASGAPFVPGCPKETPQPSPAAEVRRAQYQNRGKGLSPSVGGSTLALGSPIQPDGLGNGCQSHNGFSQASLPDNVVPESPAPPPSEAPVTGRSPAPKPSDTSGGLPAGTLPGQGDGKSQNIYESGMYWKFPGLVKGCTCEL